MDHRQAETGSLAPLLRGEERIEDALHGWGVHARPSIGYGEPEIVTGGQEAIAFRGWDGNIGKFYAQHASLFPHCVGAIRAEVHDDLLHLDRVGQHQSVGGGIARENLDGGGQ